MPEGDSLSGNHSNIRDTADEDNEVRIWTRLKTMIFGRDQEPTLRETLEEAIAEHEEESEGDLTTDNDGDLSAVERTMLRNLLHFSEHDADETDPTCKGMEEPTVELICGGESVFSLTSSS